MNPCGKQWHQSEWSANEHLKSMLAQPRIKRPDLLGVYFCEACEGWHVGHNYMLAWKDSLCIGEHK